MRFPRGVCPGLEKSLSAVPRTQLSPRHKRVAPAPSHTLYLDCPVRGERLTGCMLRLLITEVDFNGSQHMPSLSDETESDVAAL
jgi:hypothetical protein